MVTRLHAFHVIRHVPTTRSIFKSMKDLSPNPRTSGLRLIRYIRSESSSFLYFHISEELGFIVLDSRSKKSDMHKAIELCFFTGRDCLGV